MFCLDDLHAAAKRMHALANLLSDPADAEIAHQYAEELRREADRGSGGPDVPLFRWSQPKPSERWAEFLADTLEKLYPPLADRRFDALLVDLDRASSRH
jgi:hypothetical protein